MRLFRRILVIVVIALGLIFIGTEWIFPMALSFYAARTALPVARVVPAELQDHSISQSPVKKLSYFGYEFEVPWSDLDESQTTLHPKTKPQFMVELHFHSGLRLIVESLRRSAVGSVAIGENTNH